MNSPSSRAAVFLAATLLGACGRPATEADCQLVLDKLVEVELKAAKTTDPDSVAKKQASLRESMKNELKDCVGRKVSDRMLGCVREAQATADVLACIR